ncbi:site-specific integrase [Streptomyces sp. NBC_01210]|uniref:tyrosine-type recombinase/integrase n=1 Tax=Streptomyces sp. NBC_01210 TaxID=2903774 RepID=UPI002E12249F|nr:site-specific integrase [Streptomyces sp. NBC_01210]
MANRKGRRRSFGSVRQLASGRWQVRYRDPENGLLRPAEKTYETKTDAQVALTHIEADVTRGQWADPDAGAVNFADYASAWLRDRKLADRTRERNESVMRLHIVPVFGAGSIADVTTARVRSWRGKLLAAGVGEPTVVKAYQLLRALMNTAVDDELIRRNLCRIKGADSHDVPERPVLSVAEVFAVADAIGSRYRLLVLLAAFTTLRFGELAGLRRKDIDLAGRVVVVRRAQAELCRTGGSSTRRPSQPRAFGRFPSRLSWSTRSGTTWSTAPPRDRKVTCSSVRRAGSFGGATSGMTGSRPGRRRVSRHHNRQRASLGGNPS